MIVSFRFHITLNCSGLKSTNCTRNIRKSLIHPEKNQIINKQKQENKFNLSILFYYFFAITDYSISHATNRRHSMRQYEGSQHIKKICIKHAISTAEIRLFMPSLCSGRAKFVCRDVFNYWLCWLLWRFIKSAICWSDLKSPFLLNGQ